MLGLVREVCTARFFGAGVATDMFFMAFQVPNQFRALFGEGALNASFVPIYAREGLDPAGDARRLLNAVMTALAALLMAITLLAWLLCGAAMLSGLLAQKWRLFCLLLMILMPYLPLICLTALQGAALNVKGHFLRPAFAPTIMNICWIGAIVLLWRCGVTDLNRGVTALAVGVLISGGLQFAYQALMLRRCGMHFRLVWDLAHPGLRQIVQLMLPVALGVGVIQVNTFVDQLFAQFCVKDAGANSALFYGNRLMQFPLGVLGIALATAVLPALAHHEAVGDRKAFLSAVGLSLRTAFFVSLPCVAATVALSAPIVRVLYQGGRFTADATARTAAVFLCFTLGLWAFCGVQVLARAFYAQQDIAHAPANRRDDGRRELHPERDPGLADARGGPGAGEQHLRSREHGAAVDTPEKEDRSDRRARRGGQRDEVRRRRRGRRARRVRRVLRNSAGGRRAGDGRAAGLANPGARAAAWRRCARPSCWRPGRCARRSCASSSQSFRRKKDPAPSDG